MNRISVLCQVQVLNCRDERQYREPRLLHAHRARKGPVYGELLPNHSDGKRDQYQYSGAGNLVRSGVGLGAHHHGPSRIPFRLSLAHREAKLRNGQLHGAHRMLPMGRLHDERPLFR